MDSERIDLTPLDPTVDAVRWEMLLGGIRERTAVEMALRADRGVLGVLGNWAWPLLAAASIVAVLSGGALALLRPPEPFSGVIQALQVSEPVSTWLEQGGPITTSDVLLALERGGTE